MKFDKNLFNFDGMYLTYGPERRFVARFKHAGHGKASFQTFLIKNFTVEEYFQRMDAGESALTIAMSKGYILPNIRIGSEIAARNQITDPTSQRC